MGVIKTFSEFINESIWSDIQDRSAGDVFFKNSEDARTVIDNPNFRDILDVIYKD